MSFTIHYFIFNFKCYSILHFAVCVCSLYAGLSCFLKKKYFVHNEPKPRILLLMNQNQAYSCLCARTKHTHAYGPAPACPYYSVSSNLKTNSNTPEHLFCARLILYVTPYFSRHIWVSLEVYDTSEDRQ